MSNAPGRYVLIMPARNEAATIAATIQSVAAQSRKPTLLVVVDDGSTDATAEIAAKYAEEHAWLQLVSRPDRGHDAVGGGVVDTFNDGLPALKGVDYDYIGKLDADIELGADYFDSLVSRMDDDPKLGIASGQNYTRGADGSLSVERHQDFHPVGGARLYRADVFAAIGGLVASPGWDTLDLVRAWLHGYKTQAYDELRVIHLRPMGTRNELREGVLRLGRISYLLGYSRLYFALRVAFFALRSPLLLRGWWLARGYLGAALAGETRIAGADEIRALRRFQLRRLIGGKS